MLETALDAVIIAPATLVFVEVLLRCRLFGHVRRLQKQAAQSLKVLTARRISDHWKEQVLPVYALAILKTTFILLSSLVAMFAAFLVVYYLAGRLVREDFSVPEELSRTAPQIFSAMIGITYGLVRARFGRR
jgi:hypothetical protein